MGFSDAFGDDAGNTFGTALGAIGMALMSGDSREPFKNLPQFMAIANRNAQTQTSRSALKALLTQAGYDDATASQLAQSETATKVALDRAQQQKNLSAVSGLVGSAPSGDYTGGNLGMGAPSTGTGAAAPSFSGGARPMAMPTGGTAEIQGKFTDALKSGGLTNPYGLAAMTAYAQHESRYSPDNITGSWSDPSESGQAGTSGGILSWRGDRLSKMRAMTAGARDPVTAQAKFALVENPDLTMALQNAKSPEEANSLMANAWKFAGYNRQGGEFANRLATTQAYAQRLGGGGSAPAPTPSAPQQVAQAPDAMPTDKRPAYAYPVGNEPGAFGTATGPAAGRQQAAPQQVASNDPNFVPGAAKAPAPQEEDSDSPNFGPTASSQTEGTSREKVAAATQLKQAGPVPVPLPTSGPGSNGTTQLALAQRNKAWAEKVMVLAPTLGDAGKGLTELAKSRLDEANKVISGRFGQPFKDADGVTWQVGPNGQWSKLDAGDRLSTVTGPDGNTYSINKQDPSSPPVKVGLPDAGARVWGTQGPDGKPIAAPPGTPPGTPGYYDAQGVPHVALTQGTNQLGQKANQSLDDSIIKDIGESKAKATGAIGTLKAINRQMEAIDNGSITGWGADWQTKARAMASKILGLPDEALTNSQVFDAASTQKQAELAKAISQAGHTTNMDLQLGKTIAGGNREQTEAAIKAIVEAQRQIAIDTINEHNEGVAKYAEINPDAGQRAAWYKVKTPDLYAYKANRVGPDRTDVQGPPMPAPGMQGQSDPAPERPAAPAQPMPQTLTDKAMSIQNAKAAVKRNPAMRQQIIDRLEAGGIPTANLGL